MTNQEAIHYLTSMDGVGEPAKYDEALAMAIKALDVQPTLIEALTDLIDCVETGGYEEVGSAVKSARASLAKAKGVQS
jgi:hypothetical protein